jgi:hypothetical protein
MAHITASKNLDIAKQHANSAKKILIPLRGANHPLIHRIKGFIENDSPTKTPQSGGCQFLDFAGSHAAASHEFEHQAIPWILLGSV